MSAPDPTPGQTDPAIANEEPKQPLTAAEAWEARTSEWAAQVAAARAAGITLPGTMGTTFDPKDIRVEVGPPMTAAQFKAWQERRKNALKNFSQR